MAFSSRQSDSGPDSSSQADSPAEGIYLDPSAPETIGDQKVKRSPLFVILLTVFINLVGFGIIIPLIPFYAQDFGASKFEVGLLFASYSLMQFLFAPLWGRISDRIGRRPILLISLFGTSLSFVVFGLANSLAVLFIGRIMAGFFGAVISTAHAFIADVTEPKDRAHGMGLVGAAFGLAYLQRSNLFALAPAALVLVATGNPTRRPLRCCATICPCPRLARLTWCAIIFGFPS